MVTVKNYGDVTVTPEEVYRFLGIRDPIAQTELSPDVESAIRELEAAITPRLCYARFPLRADGDLLDLGFTKVESRDLAKNLRGCSEIILIAATVGLEVDRSIAKYSRLSPSRGLILQAAGAAAVENILDRATEEFIAEGLALRPRFSCGYGDLPLTLQREIFASLDCPRSIGVSLTDSLLMTPTKSVSAIIGIE